MMTTTGTTTEVSPITGLPHWDNQPEDLPAAVREIKRAIRERIAAHGRSV
jgi:hypothetical protein